MLNDYYKQIDIPAITADNKPYLRRKLEEMTDVWDVVKEATAWKWWDYSFQLDMIDKQLEICERHWGIGTRYVGDKFTKGRIVVVRSFYKKYKESSDIYEKDKYLKKFLHGYCRLLPKLWD